MSTFGTWEETRQHVQVEMERTAKNLHDLREAVHIVSLHNARQTEILERLDYSITGNGKPGMGDRVLLLEQTDASRTKFFWIVLTALTTMLCGQVVMGVVAYRTAQAQVQGK
jgi:hypothetical protein